jgi:PAS domain S-box-containing protein
VKNDMNAVFARNYFLFVIILLACAGSLGYGLVVSEQDVDKTGETVSHSYEVITTSEQLARLVDGLVASQRGYLLTGKQEFLQQYDTRKSKVSDLLAKLSRLTSDNQGQQSRLDEIRDYFVQYTLRLEQRVHDLRPGSPANVPEVSVIDDIRENIIRINDSLLKHEYELLGKRISLVDLKKGQYFNTLMAGIGVGTVLLLAFNGFLLQAQQRRFLAEASLKDTEQRFMLAIEGTQDGIFDWDIGNGQVFYSRRFFEMLGYERNATIAPIQEFTELLHPEDADKAWLHINRYLDGEVSEYSQEYRLKHKSGRWLWVQSRAKALFDEFQRPQRMVGAHTDISHIVRAQEKLQTEKQLAEEASRAKSEFLAHMSHEIRTPLTAISGIAEILARTTRNFDEKQKNLVATLGSSSTALKDLISDVLDFSKIESGDIELDRRAFMLDEMLEEVISMMALRANEKGISFLCDYQGVQQLEFIGDRSRVRQICVNLVGNAIKFTDQGSVTVQASIEDRSGTHFLRIDIADTGIGIAAEDFDLVFERFKQADASVSRKYGGTGLGLPISRKLAVLMGGDIIVASRLGVGSTFSMLLPVPASGEKFGRYVGSADLREINDEIRALITAQNRLLLVEDYEGNIVVISYMLDDLGLAYDVARTGAQALERWNVNHYDLVLMDIQMPEMDGFSATREIRRREQLENMQHTPIIGMTAHALVGDKDKCIDAGMDAYLPKPIVEADLKKELLRLLSQK